MGESRVGAAYQKFDFVSGTIFFCWSEDIMQVFGISVLASTERVDLK